MLSLRNLLRPSPSISRKPKQRERGNAVLEVSLLAPWILFLFVGVFDMGFYTTAMLGVENATRVAAETTSQNTTVAGNSDLACTKAMLEMAMLPNVHSQANCNAATTTNTVIVTAAMVSGPDGKPATSVSVTYRGGQLIPIPGLLMGRLNLTRNVQMRVKP